MDTHCEVYSERASNISDLNDLAPFLDPRKTPPIIIERRVAIGLALRSTYVCLYYAPAPVGEAGALGGHRHPSSVRPSV